MNGESVKSQDGILNKDKEGHIGLRVEKWMVSVLLSLCNSGGMQNEQNHLKSVSFPISF